MERRLSCKRREKAGLWAGMAIVCALALVGNASAAEEPLVMRLLDMEQPSVLPPPGERGGTFSSYDRRAHYDEATGKYVEWYANLNLIKNQGDGPTTLGIDPDHLMWIFAEMDGPGCIWHLWSAIPLDGHLRIVLDGEIVIDEKFHDYFNGSLPYFDYPALAYEMVEDQNGNGILDPGEDTNRNGVLDVRGANNYIPIPFRESCKVLATVGEDVNANGILDPGEDFDGDGELDPGWGAYYQIDYSLFDSAEGIETFSTDLSEADEAALQYVNDFLMNDLGTHPAGAQAGDVRVPESGHSSVVVEPGEEVVLLDVDGPRAIKEMYLRVNGLESRLDEILALRGLSLSIRWDGETDPSVWAPLGDFFGSAPGINPYKSLPLGLGDDGFFYCFWYLPFESEAVVTVRNDGDEPRNLDAAFVHTELTKPIEELGRFHAKWQRNSDTPMRLDRWPDWTFLETAGRGRFVGTALHVFSNAEFCPNASEGRLWFGEGDHKFFVDADPFPVAFGTGTEDYFGYAWANPMLFNNAFHSQTLNQYFNVGSVSLNRWHISGAVPFQGYFEGALEKYYSEMCARYASTAYWYLDTEGVDPYLAVPVDERTNYFVKDATLGGRWELYGTANLKFAGEVWDSSAHQATGILQGGATFRTDTRSGVTGMELNGAGQYLEIVNNPPYYNLTGPMTVMAWIKVDEFDTPSQAILGKGGDAYRLQRSGETDTLEFVCDGLSVPVVKGKKKVADGQWHLVAGVYDGSKLRLIVDGAPDGSVNSQGAIQTNAANVRVGSLEGEARDFEGLIAEARIYDGALATHEVNTIYRAGLQSHLMARWSFDKDGQDASGNEVDAELVNATIDPDAIQGPGCLRLTGDGYAMAPDSEQFRITEELTISTWIRVDPAFDKPFQAIINRAQDTWRLERFDETDTLGFGCEGLFEGFGFFQKYTGSFVPVNDGEWHHIVAVYRRAGDFLNFDSLLIYVDGAWAGQAFTLSWPFTEMAINNEPVMIGAMAGFDRNFKGSIDDVRIYDCRLTDSEIGEVFLDREAAPRGNPQPGRNP